MEINGHTPGDLQALLQLINDDGSSLSLKKVTAGFDGFVDTIVKIIRDKQPGQPAMMFSNIDEFGSYIKGKSGTGFSLELEERTVKLGGNMPIMCNALGTLGVATNCIGAFGFPRPHFVFETLSSKCNIYSFTNPGTSTAIEFQDGKMILGQMDTLHQAGWEKIKDTIGLSNLVDLFKESDLLTIVNWAEIDASTAIWKGVLTEVLPAYETNEKQPIFFDLSDLSKRSRAEILEAIELIKKFSQWAYTILGLNQNEAKLIYSTILEEEPNSDLKILGEILFNQLRPGILVLHSTRQSFAYDDLGTYHCNSFFVEDPKISTGAGDNFNAGFCAGLLLKAGPNNSLLLASAVSALYVANGASPHINEVISLLENHIK